VTEGAQISGLTVVFSLVESNWIRTTAKHTSVR